MDRLLGRFTLPEVAELAHMLMWNCFFHQINNLFDIDLDHDDLREYVAWRDTFAPGPSGVGRAGVERRGVLGEHEPT
jgi:hypothetical protein